MWLPCPWGFQPFGITRTLPWSAWTSGSHFVVRQMSLKAAHHLLPPQLPQCTGDSEQSASLPHWHDCCALLVPAIHPSQPHKGAVSSSGEVMALEAKLLLRTSKQGGPQKDCDSTRQSRACWCGHQKCDSVVPLACWGMGFLCVLQGWF